MTRLATLTAAAVLLGVLAFKAPAARPLDGTFESPEALASAVLDALARKDRGALEAFALSEGEFREHVWPALPASRPERNLTARFIWQDLRARSEGHLAAHLQRTLPAGARVVQVRFDGEATNYGTFVVHRQSRVVVADGQGTEASLRVFGSVLVKDGRYKVFSYVTD